MYYQINSNKSFHNKNYKYIKSIFNKMMNRFATPAMDNMFIG